MLNSLRGRGRDLSDRCACLHCLLDHPLTGHDLNGKLECPRGGQIYVNRQKGGNRNMSSVDSLIVLIQSVNGMGNCTRIGLALDMSGLAHVNLITRL